MFSSSHLVAFSLHFQFPTSSLEIKKISLLTQRPTRQGTPPWDSSSLFSMPPKQLIADGTCTWHRSPSLTSRNTKIHLKRQRSTLIKLRINSTKLAPRKLLWLSQYVTFLFPFPLRLYPRSWSFSGPVIVLDVHIFIIKRRGKVHGVCGSGVECRSFGGGKGARGKFLGGRIKSPRAGDGVV